MSNEHIEELREWLQGRRPGWDIRPAVRALIEQQAAPVGEREAFEAWFNKEKLPSVSYGNPNILKKPLWPAFQAGAAHQRQQAREVVMPPLMPSEPFTTIDRGSKNFRAGWNAYAQEFARLNKGAGSHE